MQAPFLAGKQKSRDVVLPGKAPWFDTGNGKWIRGNRRIRVTSQPLETPLYIRDGSILPFARIAEAEHRFDGAKVDFHIYLSDNTTASIRYVFDDGHSFAYQTGAQSEVEIVAQREGSHLSITVNEQQGERAAGISLSRQLTTSTSLASTGKKRIASALRA